MFSTLCWLRLPSDQYAHMLHVMGLTVRCAKNNFLIIRNGPFVFRINKMWMNLACANATNRALSILEMEIIPNGNVLQCLHSALSDLNVFIESSLIVHHTFSRTIHVKVLWRPCFPHTKKKENTIPQKCYDWLEVYRCSNSPLNFVFFCRIRWMRLCLCSSRMCVSVYVHLSCAQPNRHNHNVISLIELAVNWSAYTFCLWTVADARHSPEKTQFRQLQ